MVPHSHDRKLANNVEKQQFKESKNSTSSSFKRLNFSNQRSSSVSNIETPTKDNISYPSPISKTDEKRVSRDARKRCFKYQGFRHLQADCPN